MEKYIARRVRDRAIEILSTKPSGVRYKSLVDAIVEEMPGTTASQVGCLISELPNTRPNAVVRKARGLFALVPAAQAPQAEPDPSPIPCGGPVAQSLCDFGFEEVGAWFPSDFGIAFRLSLHADRAGLLYAFVVRGEVVYIGKSMGTLSEQMHAYEVPHVRQTVDVIGHSRIKTALRSVPTVVIYALVDHGESKSGGMPEVFAAGLEQVLIGALRPSWNE